MGQVQSAIAPELLEVCSEPRIILINLYQDGSIESGVAYRPRNEAFRDVIIPGLRANFGHCRILSANLRMYEKELFEQVIQEGDIVLLFPAGFFTIDEFVTSLLPIAERITTRENIAVILSNSYNPLALHTYINYTSSINLRAAKVLVYYDLPDIVGPRARELYEFIERALKRHTNNESRFTVGVETP